MMPASGSIGRKGSATGWSGGRLAQRAAIDALGCPFGRDREPVGHQERQRHLPGRLRSRPRRVGEGSRDRGVRPLGGSAPAETQAAATRAATSTRAAVTRACEEDTFAWAIAAS